MIGLVGTTIVPYNLFLASGIGHGQSQAEMRIGVTMAVVIGGLISIGILLAGTLIVGEYSYEAFVQGLTPAFGVMAKWVVGLGLFAAGFTSAMTAPLGAAVTGQSLFGVQQNWKQQGQRYRLTWLIVLGTGFIFGITGIRPIPVIILAQALNGLLLPVVGRFLFKVINDRSLFSNDYNTTLMNILFLFILAIIIFIGVFKLGQAVGKLLRQIETILPAISAGLTLIWIGILILHHLLAAATQALDELCRLLNARLPDRTYHVTPDSLRNIWNSYSYEYVCYLREFCEHLSGDPQFHVNVGTDRKVPPLIQILYRPFSTPKLYKMWPYFGSRYVRGVLEFEVGRVTRRSAVLRMTFTDRALVQFGPYRKRCVDVICLSCKSSIARVQTQMHGTPAATVRDLSCTANGDPYCEWEFTWTPKVRSSVLCPPRKTMRPSA